MSVVAEILGRGAEVASSPAVDEALQTELWLAELAADVRVLDILPLDHIELDDPLELFAAELLAAYPAA